METTLRADLSLALGPNRVGNKEARQQLTQIFVTQLGLSNDDAQRMLNAPGPFLISTRHETTEIKTAITDLEALGVLVKASTSRQGTRHPDFLSINPPVSKAALYSFQYGDLLGTGRVRSLPAWNRAPRAKALRTRILGITVTTAVIISGIAIFSFKMSSGELADSGWSADKPIPPRSASVVAPEHGDSSATFSGTASTEGFRFFLQVSRSGNNYSARLKGERIDVGAAHGRLEGEPVFLSSDEEELQANTPVSVSDQHEISSFGTAHISIKCDSHGSPYRARLIIDMAKSSLALGQEISDSTDVSLELLSR